MTEREISKEIKLSLYLKDGLFNYDYEIGTSKGHGDMPLSADALAYFTGVLHHVSRFDNFKSKQSMDELVDDLKVRAWLEKNPDQAKEIAKDPRKWADKK